MINDFAPHLSYRFFRKTLHIQTKLIRGALKVFNTFRVNYDCPELRIPLSASIGFNNIYWKKSWKTEVLGRLADADGGVFIDVGANIGQTLLDFLVAHPKAHYVGFEPNISCVFYLKELIRSNSFDNCLIIPTGLADETQCLTLYRTRGNLDDVCATIIPDLRPGRLCDIEHVPCFKFDEIRHSLGIENINFIKIDVEGAELESLAGMRKSLEECRPIILCEVLFADDKADLAHHEVRNKQLMQFLEELNYEVLQLHKSADDAHVIDARKIRNFTCEYWSHENKDFCDYLFIPEEKKAFVVNALLPGR